MKVLSRIFSVLVVLVIAASALSVAVYAKSTSYEIKELGMTLSIPNDMPAVTRHSKKNDSYFSKFNLDYKETMERFKDGNIYLQGIKQDNALTLTVTMTKDKNSEKINNYAYLSSAQLKGVMNKYLNDNAYKSGSVVACNGLKYIFLTMSTKSGKKIVQAQQYLTIVNGMNINLTLAAPAGQKLTSDDKELFTAVIESTRIPENSFLVRYQSFIIYGGVTLLGIIIVLVVFILLYKHFKNPKRKHANIVHDLAHRRRISETTKIPRKKTIFSVTKPTMSFMKNYQPAPEIGSEAPEPEEIPDMPAQEAPIIDVSEIEEQPPVVSKSSEKFKDEPLAEKKHTREVPIAEKIVANNVKSVSEPIEEEEEIPIAEPMEFSEKPEKPERKRPYESEVEIVEPDGERKTFGEADDYFEEIPDKEDMYSYTDVKTAVDEYTAAKEESRMIREESLETREAVIRVFKAIGRGILNVLKGIWMVICYIAIHLKYFTINVYRAIKKSRAQKKRRKIEEERKRKAAEQRRRQREAQRERARQNANRGENDLVKVRSSEERRPVRRNVYPQSRRPDGTQRRRPDNAQRRRPDSSQHRPRRG